MNQCSECLKAANGNCGKHLESYMGSVSYEAPPPEKTVAMLIIEAVEKELAAERARWAPVIAAWKMGNPKNHEACGCKKCFALGQALQSVAR
jgi:hypothetical protein